MGGKRWVDDDDKVRALMETVEWKTYVDIERIARKLGMFKDRKEGTIAARAAQLDPNKISPEPCEEDVQLSMEETANTFIQVRAQDYMTLKERLAETEKKLAEVMAEAAEVKGKYEELLQATLYDSGPYQFKNGGYGLFFSYLNILRCLERIEPDKCEAYINTVNKPNEDTL